MDDLKTQLEAAEKESLLRVVELQLAMKALLAPLRDAERVVLELPVLDSEHTLMNQLAQSGLQEVVVQLMNAAYMAMSRGFDLAITAFEVVGAVRWVADRGDLAAPGAMVPTDGRD